MQKARLEILPLEVHWLHKKTKHIGSSMMELNVCGAIPPYNEILGGKLVALFSNLSAGYSRL